MSCDRFREWILDRAAGALADEQGRELDAHLATCDACADEAALYARLGSDLDVAARLPDATRGLAELEAKVAAEHGRHAVAPASAGGPGWRGLAPRIAAAVALVALGIVAGLGLDGLRESADEADDVVPRFALLVYELDDEGPPRAQVVEEVNSWARGLFADGVVTDGAELRPGLAFTGPPPQDIGFARRVSHYIVIRAADLEAARRVAATAPVHAYGGVVEVRPLQ